MTLICTSVGKTFSDYNELKAEKIPRTYKTPDDEVMEDMQRQFHIPDSLKDKSMDEITPEEWDKVITPQHKELSEAK